MKGQNVIEFNINTIKEAMEYYLNNAVLKDSVKVLSVRNSDEMGFTVTIEEVKNEV